MNRPTSRRDFLRGNSAVRAMGDLIQAALPASWDEPAPMAPASEADSYLLEISRPAMATRFQIQLNVGQYEQGTEAAIEALDQIEALESELSYFRDSSTISQLNRRASEEPVKIEVGLFGLLELALKTAHQTGGAYDITSTPLWKAWGFARRDGRIPSPDELQQALECIGSQWVQLDREESTVRFLKKGIELNLGSVGKGYALDCVTELLLARGIKDFLIHGGQSSVLGRGCRGFRTGVSRGMNDDVGWLVGIPHPLQPGVRLGEARLRNRALGTSGAANQSFMHRGKRYGHILDPRTGQPAEGVYSVTVFAPSAAQADALSTAFYVMGPERAITYCQEVPDLATIVICPSKGGHDFEIRTVGLSEDDFRLLKGDAPIARAESRLPER